MDTKDMLWNSPPAPLGKTRPAERIWTMRKDGKRVDAELQGHGEYGWECQFLYGGELAYGRRWDLRAEAEEKRRELEAEEWLVVDPPKG